MSNHAFDSLEFTWLAVSVVTPALPMIGNGLNPAFSPPPPESVSFDVELPALVWEPDLPDDDGEIFFSSSSTTTFSPWLGLVAMAASPPPPVVAPVVTSAGTYLDQARIRAP